MTTTRRLAPALLALSLGLGLSACGGEEQTQPLPTEGTIEMDEGADSSSPSPSASARYTDPEDEPIDDATRTRLERVALEEVPDGRIEDVERSDESTHAFEVDVEIGDDDVTVEISEDFQVVRVDR